MLAILNGEENEKIVLNVFSAYDKNLQFTMEKEVNNSIHFLDMTIMRQNDGSLKIKWYQKEVISGRYLNFHGHNPICHKRNVVTGLVDRAITFTNPNERPNSLKRVRELMNNNGYPTHFTEKIIIKERVDKFYNHNQQKHKNEIKRYIAAPYVPGLSDRLKKIIG